MREKFQEFDMRLCGVLFGSLSLQSASAPRPSLPSHSPTANSDSYYYSSSDEEESDDGDDTDDSYDSDESEVAYRRTPTPPADTGIKRSRKNHPRDKVKVLTEWIEEHRENPYPTEDEKAELCARLDMPKTQLNSWSINGEYRHKSRVRLVWVKEGAMNRGVGDMDI
ncbi:hypothetical protein HK104_001545 [Borealophlyctis nickersoniae]|nr:hypothetical protein HK104_001545 [Borealophlyctis nickersoniae]